MRWFASFSAFRSAFRLVLGLSSLCLIPAVGCGACDPQPVGEDDGGPDDNDAGPDDDECTTVTFGDVFLDSEQDVQTIFTAPLTTELGNGVPDFLLFTFVNINPRFGVLGEGTFDLATDPNDNRSTCAECVLVFEDQLTETSPPARVFFQRSGSMVVEANPRGNRFLKIGVSGLVLEEVVIDNGDLTSTPVEGGACLRIDDFSIDYTALPDGWTCDAALYNDGACNCDCGGFDPDCACDPFQNPDCPLVIEDDCPTGTTCSPGLGCLAQCDMFSDPVVPCGFGELCGFGEDGPNCIDATNRVNPAMLGETCENIEIFAQYCNVENTVPSGFCDDLDGGRCKRLCGPENPCPDNEACYTVAGGGGGYCPGNPPGDVPAAWTCDPDAWGDTFVCDCACGASDPDCASGERSVNGCNNGEGCFDGMCE